MHYSSWDVHIISAGLWVGDPSQEKHSESTKFKLFQVYVALICKITLTSDRHFALTTTTQLICADWLPGWPKMRKQLSEDLNYELINALWNMSLVPNQVARGYHGNILCCVHHITAKYDMHAVEPTIGYVVELEQAWHDSILLLWLYVHWLLGAMNMYNLLMWV